MSYLSDMICETQLNVFSLYIGDHIFGGYAQLKSKILIGTVPQNAFSQDSKITKKVTYEILTQRFRATELVKWLSWAVAIRCISARSGFDSPTL